MLPVFTELFVESIPTNSFVGSKPAEGFIPHVDKKADKRLNSQLLQKMKLSLFAIKRIKTIVEYAASFYDMNEDITLLLILLPYAYITQSQDKLLEKIHNRNKSLSKISNESIKIAELYLGEYDE